MKKAIHASLFHVASSANQHWHSHCPDGLSSWCQFKKDKAAGTTNLYKPGKGLPMNIVHQIKPIYDDLKIVSWKNAYMVERKTQTKV